MNHIEKIRDYIEEVRARADANKRFLKTMQLTNIAEVCAMHMSFKGRLENISILLTMLESLLDGCEKVQKFEIGFFSQYSAGPTTWTDKQVFNPAQEAIEKAANPLSTKKQESEK